MINAPKISAFALMSISLSGCVRQEYQTNARVNEDPLVVDQAMQQRDWDKSHAVYQNGSTYNWSTGFAFAARGDLPIGFNYVADVGTYFGNLVTLPVTAVVERDGVQSQGVVVPSSYTAVPPVPPRSSSRRPNVGAQDSGLGNGQNGDSGGINTVGNPDEAQNNALNSTVTGNRSDDNSTNGGRSNQGGAFDAAGADVGPGNASGSGRNGRGSGGSATGSGAGGAGGAGGGGR